MTSDAITLITGSGTIEIVATVASGRARYGLCQFAGVVKQSAYATKKLTSETLEDSWLIEPMTTVLVEMYAASVGTWRHLGRVARSSVLFGHELGLSNGALMSLQCAALLHEVGKLTMPAELLNKTSPLERDEWYSITKHATVITKKLKERSLPSSVISAAQSHHERYDGSGYPLGLAGEEIPLTARILTIADAFDTMRSDRPYRPARNIQETLTEFADGAGTQFDPELVRRFWPMLESGLADEKAVKTLKVVSDDPNLYRHLWFAAVPHGWELSPWPARWAKYCPAEVAGDAGDAGDYSARQRDAHGSALTIIDGRRAGLLPRKVLAELEGDAIWIDPYKDGKQALETPLDLRDVLALLHRSGREEWTRTPSVKIRVLIADPYHLFRQVLRRCLDERDDVEVVAEVASPQAYRRALIEETFDVAIVASDLMSGTHTTSPLSPVHLRLDHGELITGHLRIQPTIVLVADEDVDDYEVGLYDAPLTTGKLEESPINCVYVHRGAPAERLVEAMKSILGASWASRVGT